VAVAAGVGQVAAVEAASLDAAPVAKNKQFAGIRGECSWQKNKLVVRVLVLVVTIVITHQQPEHFHMGSLLK
jgi:hypothetical protein